MQRAELLMKLGLAVCWFIFAVPLRERLEKTGGNAEDIENKGIGGKATRKLMKGKVLKIDG
jgi:hypothetical protein